MVWFITAKMMARLIIKATEVFARPEEPIIAFCVIKNSWVARMRIGSNWKQGSPSCIFPDCSVRVIHTTAFNLPFIGSFFKPEIQQTANATWLIT